MRRLLHHARVMLAEQRGGLGKVPAVDPLGNSAASPCCAAAVKSPSAFCEAATIRWPMHSASASHRRANRNPGKAAGQTGRAAPPLHGSAQAGDAYELRRDAAGEKRGTTVIGSIQCNSRAPVIAEKAKPATPAAQAPAKTDATVRRL